MKDMMAKKEVLDEIMKLMDDKDGDMLRKHPKIAKVDIESNDPALADELKDKMMGVEGEEMSAMDVEKSEMNPEDMQKLMELYKKLKG